ncbi:MAG: hypothetical protein ACJAWH_000781 [Maribacter sp.]|jgi:hypothetical protein
MEVHGKKGVNFDIEIYLYTCVSFHLTANFLVYNAECRTSL